MFRPHLRRDLARTARGVDRILGQRRGIGDVLDVEPQPRGASLLHHLAEEIFQRGQLFAVGESASRAQFGQRMLPRVHAVDPALAVGMGHDDVVVLRPVDVALRAVASRSEASELSGALHSVAPPRWATMLLVHAAGFNKPSSTSSSGLGIWLQSGCAGHSSSVQAKSRSAAAVSENIFFNMVFVF